MTSRLDAALQYANLGYAVFPCSPGDRPTPLTAHGWKDATVDLDQIEQWWTANPSANIGLSTAGLVVIDVDGADNPWLTNDPERAAQLAAAPTARTPRGGRHHVFRKPAGKNWRCSAGQIAAHVDVRTDGGFIVVPPSARPDGSYHWVEGCELDVSPDKLKEPPAWLWQLLDGKSDGPAPAPSIASVVSGMIPEGQRNMTLARLGGIMRRVGMTEAEIGAGLGRVNRDRCSPQLGPDEVAEIAASVASYPPDQISVAVVEDHYSRLKIGTPPKEPFEWLDCRGLASGNFELEYLVEGLLVRGQPAIIAGPKKALKTSLIIDLALALSQKHPFLGKFPVAKAVRVGVMSGESGAATLQETAARVAAANGLSLADCDDLYWCFDVPQLDSAIHLAALRRFVEAKKLDVLFIDPTYLAMLSVGDDAGNMFVMGRLLKCVGDFSRETGLTTVLCHHFRKNMPEPYEPAELEHIAFSGFQEFARQWLLVNRRVPYDPQRGGHHELWLSVGGSAGHSGLWGVNVDEGTRQDKGGRRWEVESLSIGQAYATRDDAKREKAEQRKQGAEAARSQKREKTIRRALRASPDGETQRGLRIATGFSNDALNEALDMLLESGVVVECSVTRNKRSERGYRLSAPESSAGKEESPKR